MNQGPSSTIRDASSSCKPGAMVFLGIALLAVSAVAMSAEVETPTLEHVLTVRASLDPMVSMGKTPEGERRVVPITGGTFEGPGLKGTIMPGGEDWQLIREDGVMQLDARYWLRTEDGAIIRVHNQVLVGLSAARPGSRATLPALDRSIRSAHREVRLVEPGRVRRHDHARHDATATGCRPAFLQGDVGRSFPDGQLRKEERTRLKK